MASLVSVEENADTTNGSVFNTGAFGIAEGKSYYFVVAASNATDPGTPTLTGQGEGEWSVVASAVASAAVTSRLYVFHLDRRSEEGTSLPAAVTITWSGTAARCVWSVVRLDDGDPSGVVQAVTGSGSGTSGTVNLAALRNANSLCVGLFEHHANETHTEGTDFTQVTDRASGEALGLLVETKNNDTSVDASWTTSAFWAGIALEIANLRSLESTSTWTFSVASVFAKVKSLASASSWAVGIASVLSRINKLLINATDPDVQTMTADSPETQTLTAASPETHTITADGPSTETLTAGSPDTLTIDPTDPDTTGQP